MSLVLFATILQMFIIVMLVTIYSFFKKEYILFIAIALLSLFISSVIFSVPFVVNSNFEFVKYFLNIAGSMMITHGFLLVIEKKLNKKIIISMVLLTALTVAVFKDNNEIKSLVVLLLGIMLMFFVLYNYIKLSSKNNFKGFKLLLTANIVVIIVHIADFVYLSLVWAGVCNYSNNMLMIVYAGLTIFQFLTIAGVFVVTQELIENQERVNREILLQKEDYFNQMQETNSLLDKSKAFLYKLVSIECDKIIVSKELAIYMGMDDEELEYKNENEYFLDRALFWEKYINENYCYLKITKSKILNGEIDLDKVYHIKAYRYLNGRREKRWFELSYIANGKGGFDVVVLDITRLKNTIRADYLTGVRNNVAFSEDFENKCFEEHVIAFADIDRFKEVNDSFGHIAGDEVLIKTANKLKFGGVFTVYRISGDEFMFVTKKACKIKDVEKYINNCNFDMTLGEDDIPITVNLSVGVIEYASHHNYSRDELFDLLDGAMYDAKKHKKKYSEITECYRDYRNLFHSSAHAQVIIDIESIKNINNIDDFDIELVNIMDVSDEYVYMFKGKSKLDFIGKFPMHLFPERQPNGERSIDMISRELTNIIKKRRGDNEFTQLDLDGNELIIHQECVVINNNGVDILVVTKKDMTEKYKAEKKIRQLSERLNGVIESAKVLVWTIDYTKTPYTLWASNNVKDFFDIEQDENGYAKYEDWNRVLLEGIGEKRFKTYKKVVFKENVSILDFVKFKNGYGDYNYLTFRSKETKFDDSGKMTFLTGVVINSNSDMEKIKQIEAGKSKINQLNDRLRNLLQTSNVMICSFDYSDDMPKMWASDNAKSYLNVRQDEDGNIPYEDWGKCLNNVLKNPIDKEYFTENPFDTYLHEFEFIEFENAYGQTNYLSMRSVNTELDNNGNLAKASCIIMDTTSEAKKQRQLEINKLNFENIFEKTTMAFVIVDIDSGKMINCNESYVKMFRGKSKEDFIGKVLGTYINTDIDNEKVDSGFILEQIQKVKKFGSFKYEYNHNLNGEHEIQLEIDAVITEYNYKPAVVFSVVDITESKKFTKLLEERKRNLEENKLKYEMAEKGAKIASWHWDMKKDICYATDEFVNIFGGKSTIDRARDNFVGRLVKDDLGKSIKDLNDFIDGKIDYMSIKARFYCVNSDSYQWAQIVSQIIERDEKGDPKISTGIIMNIHKQKLREERLLKESIVDSLTGLYNLRYLSKYMKELKHKKDLKIVVGYLSIVGLRHINNSYGFESGDKLIVKVAEMLNKFKSDNTSVFRVANEEFVIITHNEVLYNSIINHESVNDFESILKGEIKIDDNYLKYRSCCGVLAYPYHTDDLDNIVYLSEMTMTYGKDNKQYIQYYDSKVIENIFYERKVIKDFNDADLEKEFELYYQPVINIKHNSFSSFEALVRWNHPEKGLLAPGCFIDILEKARLMNKLTLIIVKKVLNQILLWKEETGKNVSISLNLSPSDIESKSLIDKMLDIIENSGVDKKQIIIELLEGAFDTNDKGVINNIDKISKSGIRIAIDDFGVSYSSLSRISMIEYDVLKIDKSFAYNIEKEKNKNLVDIIYSIAKLSGAKCVAEGIETQTQLEVYKEIGVEYIQGYYFYKPMPSAMVTQLLNEE